MNKNNSVTIEEEKNIMAALNDLFPNQEWAISCYSKQGASAKIVSLVSRNKNLIARISDQKRPGANLSLEYACLKQASDLGVSPKVHYFNDVVNLVIMNYLSSPSAKERVADLKIENLAHQIYILHHSKLFSPSHSIFDLIRMIGGMLIKIFPEVSEIGQCFNLVEKYGEMLNIDEDKRPSHRDLHAFNMLCHESHYFLIDWESAGNESFYFDLAVAYNMMIAVRDKNTPEEWLAAYFQRKPTQDEQNKFHLMRVVAFAYYGLISIYLSTAVQEPRLMMQEYQALPSYQYFIQQQLEKDDPDMKGSYLAFGYACLKEALLLNVMK